jgi:nicotinamidase-related amidase
MAVTAMTNSELPVPAHFDPERVGEVWKVPYQKRAQQARAWASEHEIPAAADDEFSICCIAIDVQNTFCLPDFELFVAGRSGTGAVDDNRRFSRFIYKNLAHISQFLCTLDTHQTIQIFHSVFLVDENGDHPSPMTQISHEDIVDGRWQFNANLAESLGIDAAFAREHLEHYTRQLQEQEKFELTIWPYHALLGGISHALVPAIEEAIFFHTMARYSQPDFHIKGRHPLTEAYSALGPEVETGPDGRTLTSKTDRLFRQVQNHDAVIIGGQAKSHCVNWTIDDLLQTIRAEDPDLAEKIYLLEDCTSPVVIPDVVDFTEAANEAFERFADAGMHLVQSTDPIETWPGIIGST